MKEWLHSTLGDLCKNHGGKIQTGPFGSQLHQSDYVNDGVPVVMPKDITQQGIDILTVAKISLDNANRLSKHKLNIDEIIFPRRGEITKCALIKQEQEGFLCGTGCLQITIPKQVLNPRFFRYYLANKEIVDWLNGNAVGATMKNLSTGILQKLPVHYPPLITQQKIAGVLSSYDDLIDNNLKRIALLEEIAQITYEEWFVRFRFPNYENTEIDLTTGLPLGWVKESLSKHVNLIRGIEPGSSNYSDKPFKGCVPFLRVGDLNKRSSNIYVKKENVVEKICKQNDVLLSLDGSPGVVSIGLAGAYSTGIRKAVIKNEKISHAHIYTYLKSSYIQKLISSHATGATILHAGSAVDYMEIICPTPEILSNFNTIATVCFDEILNLKKQNNLLSEARDILLPRLMTRLIDVDTLIKDAA